MHCSFAIIISFVAGLGVGVTICWWMEGKDRDYEQRQKEFDEELKRKKLL